MTLTRKSPMKRRRSNKLDAFDRELRAAEPRVRARAHNMCELWHLSPPQPTCGGVGLVVHHRKLRSQGGTNDLDNLMLLCGSHHTYVHHEPALSYAMGWLVRGVS